MRRLAAVGAFVVFAASCAGGPSPSESPEPSPEGLVGVVASYDLAVGTQRFILGLLMPDQRLVSFDEVLFRFSYLGTREREATPSFVVAEKAKFLPIPGEPSPSSERPVAGPASQGRGVYSAEVNFDRSGFWQVVVEADVEGEGKLSGSATFEVLEKHRIPAPGDEGLRTENLTIYSSDAPSEAIDSRAIGGEEIPDKALHSTTIAQAIDEGRPVLAIFSTPVYCVSKFCGPVTDMAAELARDYRDRAAFVHVEIWRNFERREINRAAADWLLRDGDLNEPWVFLIGAGGKIAARWDNVATRGEIEPHLQQLPALGS